MNCPFVAPWIKSALSTNPNPVIWSEVFEIGAFRCTPKFCSRSMSKRGELIPFHRAGPLPLPYPFPCDVCSQSAPPCVKSESP